MTWTDVADLVEALPPGGEIVFELEGPVRIFYVKVSDDGEAVTFGLDRKRVTRKIRPVFLADVLRRSALAAVLQ